MQLGTKGNVVLYLDKEPVSNSREMGFNLSKTFENHLKHLILNYSTVNQVKHFNSSRNLGRLVGLPGFEPGSIEPKRNSSVDWFEFKKYLDCKYARCYATSIFEHSRKYLNLLDDVNGILQVKTSVRNNVINSLTALSRFLGVYDSFVADLKSHGVKRCRSDPVQAFTRIFNSGAHRGLGEWYREASGVLRENERLYLRFMLLSGVRAMEGVKAFNLIVDLGDRYTEEYYNKATGFLEHFKYPKLFLRCSKNLYVSCVPKELLDKISESSKISYNAIDKRLDRAGLPMRVKQLRSFYATTMREQGLLSEQIDLIQGRVGKSIFLQHYFKQDAKMLSKTILSILPKLEEVLSS